MRKYALPIIVLAAALALSAVPAQSPDAGPDGRLINVDGEAELKVPPDRIVLTLGIETSDRDVTKAKYLNDQRTHQVLSGLGTAGVAAKDIQTDYLEIEPRYEWSSRPENFIGYFARKTVVVTLRSVGNFEEILTGALSSGANYVLGIQFLTSELRAHRDSARALALQAAREKAAAMAAKLGHAIGEPRTISETNSRWYSSYGRGGWSSRTGSQFQNVVQNAGPGEMSADGVIAPGQISVYASVHVSFELK
jgi:uncharacterized protein